MGEIIEKGLLIGFGLTILMFSFSFITPFISFVTNPNSDEFNIQYNKIVFTIESACEYIPKTDNETSIHNFYLRDEIKIEFNTSSDKNYIKISSKLKDTIIETKRVMIFEEVLLKGSVSIEFFYFSAYFEMVVNFL